MSLSVIILCISGHGTGGGQGGRPEANTKSYVSQRFTAFEEADCIKRRNLNQLCYNLSDSSNKTALWQSNTHTHTHDIAEELSLSLCLLPLFCSWIWSRMSKTKWKTSQKTTTTKKRNNGAWWAGTARISQRSARRGAILCRLGRLRFGGRVQRAHSESWDVQTDPALGLCWRNRTSAKRS